MKKRVLCLLAAAVAALLILPSPARACDHTDEDGEPLKYVRSGYVAPQIGVPGFSGDLCCPKCGAVVIPGATLPALEKPAGAAEGSEPKNQPEPSGKEPSVQPQEPAQPETPAQPEAPTQPETPAQPEAPTQPETPAQPETPVQPETPAQPETPVQPETPAQPETPVQPETPTQPETPVQPGIPAGQEPRTQQEQPAMPAVVPTAVPGNEKKPEQQQPETGPAKTGAGNPESGRKPRERFSRQFPYRRMKMQPAKDIRAEGAGRLIWPPAASPFRHMLGE